MSPHLNITILANSTRVTLIRPAHWIKRRWSHHYLKIIGIILFVYILWGLDFEKIFEAVRRLADWKICITVALIILHFFIRTVRWKVIIASFGINQRWSKTIIEMGRAYFFGSITPARIGEAVRFQDIYKKSRSLGIGAFSLIFEKLLDLLIISLIISFCAFLYGWQVLALIGSISFIVVITVVTWIFFSQDSIRWLEKKANDLFKINLEMGEKFEIPRLDGILASGLLTFCTWGLYAVIIGSMASTIGISNINFLGILFVVCGASLSSAIPLTIAGLGIREMVIIEFGKSQQMSVELSVAFSFLFLFVYAVNMILGSLFMLTTVFLNKSE